MLWATGGVILWLGGWWFTGRLFGVYRKAIYLEAWSRRQRGLNLPTEEHHRGAVVFLIFDLGLLLLGIRSLAILKAGGDESLPDESLMAAAVEWSIFMCLYLYRQAFNLHAFYHDRWRARTGSATLEHRDAGTLKGIWRETAPWLRMGLLVAPALAAVPLGSALFGLDPVRGPGGLRAALFLWFLAPQAALLAVLAPPVFRLRRRVHGSEA